LLEHNSACLISRMHIFTFPGIMPFRPLVFSCHPLSWQPVLPELLQRFSFVFPHCFWAAQSLLDCSALHQFLAAQLRIATSLSESWPHTWEFSTAKKKWTFALYLLKIINWSASWVCPFVQFAISFLKIFSEVQSPCNWRCFLCVCATLFWYLLQQHAAWLMITPDAWYDLLVSLFPCAN
jgi:hypothetical protein